MPALKDYIGFYRVARTRSRSHNHYIRFEDYQANLVIKFLKSRNISLKGKKILDIGCGRGGYSRQFAIEGAKVTALDITREYFQNIENVSFSLGDATKMSFKDNSFDFIFCSSIIEHIKQPEKLVSEIHRVLKKGAVCYLSFPPFWSPVGSHQFKPFHYLGEKAAIKLSRFFYKVRSFTYDDKYGKLYIRKISQVKKLVKNQDFK